MPEVTACVMFACYTKGCLSQPLRPQAYAPPLMEPVPRARAGWLSGPSMAPEGRSWVVYSLPHHIILTLKNHEPLFSVSPSREAPVREDREGWPDLAPLRAGASSEGLRAHVGPSCSAQVCCAGRRGCKGQDRSFLLGRFRLCALLS